jgi:hypothetical protein
MSPEQKKDIFFRSDRHNIFSFPNAENFPIDSEKILKLRVLPFEEQQKSSGWLIVEIEEEIEGKIETRRGYLVAPESLHVKILEEIEFMKGIVSGGKSLPLIDDFCQKIKNCILWIGNPLNPELDNF